MTGKDFANYSLAVVLVLATVPMYRYLIEREREGDTRPAVSPQRVVVIHAEPVQSQKAAGFPIVGCENGKLYRYEADRIVPAGICPVVVAPSPDESDPVESSR
jgi:hypothetical protein